ncbi:UNVERIFIED_CONTAM: hypothetical protein K2H54_046765 [Gekko kuhli]
MSTLLLPCVPFPLPQHSGSSATVVLGNNTSCLQQCSLGWCPNLFQDQSILSNPTEDRMYKHLNAVDSTKPPKQSKQLNSSFINLYSHLFKWFLFKLGVYFKSPG